MTKLMPFNRDHFFTVVRNLHGALTSPQVEGFNAVLTEAELRKFDVAWTAYMLATAWWESATKMQPVREIGQGHGKAYGVRDTQTGQIYYGRGLVQITWKANYAKLGTTVGVDLVTHPDLALEMGVAVDILFDGMQLGLFTGKKLADYLTAAYIDFIGARHIVNGSDHAADIAKLADGFLSALAVAPSTFTVSTPVKGVAKPAPALAAAAPAISPAASKAPTMNPIALFTMAVSLAKDVAPYVPHLVSDVPLFVSDCEKIVADASKLDVNASLADLQKLIGDVKTEMPLILTVAKASKALALA